MLPKVQIKKLLPPLAVSCRMERCYKISKKCCLKKGFLNDQVL